jgi:hypothetical protein
MLLRGLQAIEAHGRFDDASGASRLYQLLISPVEEIWPAWQKAYGTGLPPTE